MQTRGWFSERIGVHYLKERKNSKRLHKTILEGFLECLRIWSPLNASHPENPYTVTNHKLEKKLLLLLLLLSSGNSLEYQECRTIQGKNGTV